MITDTVHLIHKSGIITDTINLVYHYSAIVDTLPKPGFQNINNIIVGGGEVSKNTSTCSFCLKDWLPLLTALIAFGGALIVTYYNLRKTAFKEKWKEFQRLMDSWRFINEWLRQTIDNLKNYRDVLVKDLEEFKSVDNEIPKFRFLELDIERVFKLKEEDLYSVFIGTRKRTDQVIVSDFYNLIITLRTINTFNNEGKEILKERTKEIEKLYDKIEDLRNELRFAEEEWINSAPLEIMKDIRPIISDYILILDDYQRRGNNNYYTTMLQSVTDKLVLYEKLQLHERASMKSIWEILTALYRVLQKLALKYRFTYDERKSITKMFNEKIQNLEILTLKFERLPFIYWKDLESVKNIKLFR